MILKNAFAPRSLLRILLPMWLAVALVFPVCAETHRKSLDKADVLRMVKAKQPEASMVAQIQQEKISFAITKPVIDELKAAGASRPVLEALRAAQPVGLVWSAATHASLGNTAMVEVTQMVSDGGGAGPSFPEFPRWGLPHPSRDFLREGGPLLRTTICMNAHETGSTPEPALPALLAPSDDPKHRTTEPTTHSSPERFLWCLCRYTGVGLARILRQP